MCGRYGLYHGKGEIEDMFQVELPMEYAPRYNIAPTQPVLIVRENPHISEGREAAHVVWGLIPPWADDPKIGSKMINARCETAAEKVSFKNPLRRRRCVLPASGFYEWQTISGSKTKQPYHIKNEDGTPMALAGLWEVWHGPNGELIESCTILTTAANKSMRDLHERMPVTIAPERIPLWLDTRNDDLSSIVEFIKLKSNSTIQPYPISTLVNSVRNDGPKLICKANTNLFDNNACLDI